MDSSKTCDEDVGRDNEPDGSGKLSLEMKHLLTTEGNSDGALTNVSGEGSKTSQNNTSQTSTEISDQQTNVNFSALSLKVDEEGLLNCGLCRHLLQDPKFLPCMHSFCKKCLESKFPLPTQSQIEKDGQPKDQASNCEDQEIAEVNGCKSKNSSKKRSQDKKESTCCPVCEEHFKMPEDRIDGLVSNTVFQKLVEAKEKTSNEKQCDICKLRDTLQQAAAFCTDCNDMLCDACWKSHSNTRFTLNHKVVSLDQVGEEEIGNAVRKSNLFCKVHSNEALKYYCNDCQTAVCRECLLLIHKDHSITTSELAARSKKSKIEILMMGFQERMKTMKKEEDKEYEMQKERLEKGETDEMIQIGEFFNSLTEAIENMRLSITERTLEDFKALKTQNDERRQCSEKLDKSMAGMKNVIDILMGQCNDEEFLLLEPLVHWRLLQMINKVVKPLPVSWYTLPKHHFSYPAEIVLRKLRRDIIVQFAQKSFKFEKPSKSFDPVEAMPCEKSGTELVRLGKLKNYYAQSLNVKQEVQEVNQVLTSQNECIVDDKAFTEEALFSRVEDLKYDSGDTAEFSDLSSADSSWVDETSIEPMQPSTKKKKPSRRGGKGGKKNKAKKAAAVVLDPNQRNHTLVLDPSQIDPTIVLDQSQVNPVVSAQLDNQVQLVTSDGRTSLAGPSIPSYIYPTSPYDYYSRVSNISNDPYYSVGTEAQYMAAPTGAPLYMNAPVCSAQVYHAANEDQSMETSETADQSHDLGATSQPIVNAESSEGQQTQQKVISLKPKWRLDVKLSSDKFDPCLNGVFCLHKTSIIVSDSKNTKVKIFSLDGQFIKSLDLQSVGVAVFTTNKLIYSANKRLCGMKEDGTQINPLTFESKCRVAWSPKGHVLVACGSKLRRYFINDERNCFVRTDNIAVGDGSVKNFTDVRCDNGGQKLVVVDGGTKSVIVSDKNGTIIGIYKEDNPNWKPTSACFDKKGNVFVTDGGGNRLVFLSGTGQRIQQWETAPTILKPSFVTTNPQQPLYITGIDRYVHVYDFSYL